MLYFQNKNKLLMRCRYLNFMIPLSGGLVLLYMILTMLMLPDWNVEPASAADGALPVTDTPSASISIANPTLTSTGRAGELVIMNSNVTISASLIDSYNLQIASGNEIATLEGPTPINPIDNTANPNGVIAANLADNTWGYSWDNSNYKGITTVNATIANDGIDTDGAVNYTRLLSFAAKFSDDASAGHYKAKVNLLLTVTPKQMTTYSLSYNANGGTGTPNPTAQTGSSYENTYSFIAAAQGTLTKANHTFLGWSESSSATTATYAAGATITLTKASPSKTLYAVWRAEGLPWLWNNNSSDPVGVYSGVTTMQEMTPDICKQVNIPAANTTKVPTLYIRDTRDGNDYTIARLPDGKCWMLENIALVNKTISSADSDIPSGSFKVPASSMYGFQSNTAIEALQSNNIGYYTWCAATAGTCPASGEAPASICPKGWKLPSSSDYIASSNKGDFQGLTDAIGLTSSTLQTSNSSGSNIFRSSPYYFGYTGRVVSSSLSLTTSGGWWWSRTAKSSTSAYSLRLAADSIKPNYSNDRYLGAAVRCVAK